MNLLKNKIKMKKKSILKNIKEIKEFVAIALLSFSLIFNLILSPNIFIYCLFITENTILRILTLIYLCWWICDRETQDKGGRRLGWLWFKDKFRCDAARDYFPVNLIKTVDLPPNRNYLFAVFPHGIASFGVMFNFVSLSSKFWKLYPGIRPRVLTLYSLFYFPFIRDFVLSQGASSASAKNIKNILRESNDPKNSINSDGFTSNAAILVPGGVREVIFSHPNEYHLIAKSRKGFIKQAIINGCPLVPVFSFGEIDLYDQPPNPPGSEIRKWQEYTKRKFSIPFIKLNGVWAFIPKRKPITTVVGGPIEVIQNENPSEEYINEIHEKFLNALTDLFETHKSKYADDPEKCQLILE